MGVLPQTATSGELPISRGFYLAYFRRRILRNLASRIFRTTDDSTVDEEEKLAAGIHGQTQGKTQCDIRSKTKIRQKMNLTETLSLTN